MIIKFDIGGQMEEVVLQEKIRDDANIQQEILSIIKCEDDCEFIREDQCPNGMYADFAIIKNNDVKALVECKGSNLSVTDYVRGIGQITTYDYYIRKNLTVKGYSYNNTYVLYCFPSDIILNKDFNIGLFPYPEKSKVLELNDKNDNIREISKTELDKFAEGGINNKVTISPLSTAIAKQCKVLLDKYYRKISK